MRFDGDIELAVSGIPDSTAALALTPNQQVSIPLACAGTSATTANTGRSCFEQVTSTFINFPHAGTGNDDDIVARVKPGNVINLGIGTDNLLRRQCQPFVPIIQRNAIPAAQNICQLRAQLLAEVAVLGSGVRDARHPLARGSKYPLDGSIHPPAVRVCIFIRQTSRIEIQIERKG